MHTLLSKLDASGLAQENTLLRERLEEAEQTLRAIRGGEVDAVVVEEDETPAVRHLVAEAILAQSILEQVADAVVICNEEGIVLRSSRAVKEQFGGDPYRKPFDEIFCLHHMEGDRTTPVTFESLLTYDQLRGFEVTSCHSNEEFHLLLSIGVLREHDGSLLGAVITLTDITERKRVEALLRQTDRRKDEFLATLAHELRNPLAPLHNALNVLRLAQHKPGVYAQAHDIMARQLKQLVRLVDDLLDVSRITRNTIELRKEIIPLTGIMETALETSRPLIESRGHALSVILPQYPVYLNADAVRMGQVFSNLLNNAAKYTPPCGKLSLQATVEDNTLILRISDNGIGIEAKMLPDIFEMFAQADSSLERSYGGLGIGLTLVKSLLALHGGTIIAASEGLGKGSEFTVRLPIALPVEKDSAPQDAQHISPAKGLTILVADDNKSSATTMGWMLELMGHTAHLLYDGSQVVETAKTLKPDAILLDIGMPGMNGYDICRALRRLPAFKDTILIAQTGWGQEQDRKMARDAGFNHHLVKPVDGDLLQKILQEEGTVRVRKEEVA